MLVVVEHNVLTDGGKAVGFQILYQRVGCCDVRLETVVVACAVGAIVRYLRNYCRLDVALGNRLRDDLLSIPSIVLDQASHIYYRFEAYLKVPNVKKFSHSFRMLVQN